MLVRPSDDVVFTEFDGGDGILVDLNTKKYFQMNATATVIWQGLNKGRTSEEIVRNIVDKYDVMPDQAARSVQRLIGTLRDLNLVHSVS